MDTLRINGQDKEFAAGKMPTTLADLLKHLGIDEITAAAEVDGQIIERQNFAHTVLRTGQDIELIRFMGGG